MSERIRLSTLRLTAHLWRETVSEYAGYFSNCGLYRPADKVQQFMEGDKMCGKCFPERPSNVGIPK